MYCGIFEIFFFKYLFLVWFFKVVFRRFYIFIFIVKGLRVRICFCFLRFRLVIVVWYVFIKIFGLEVRVRYYRFFFKLFFV